MSSPASPQTFDAARRAGLAARAAGDRAAALARFREALALDPANRWTRNDAALELVSLGRAGEAAAEAEALARDAPDFAPARRTLGLAARAAGDREAALGHFRAAAALDGRDLWNRHDAGTELAALGRPAEAAEAFRDLAEETPLSHSLRALAQIARTEGRSEDALALLRAAALLRPADPWFALDLAAELAARGRAAESEAAFEALVSARPDFLPAHRARAAACMARGESERALGHLEAALLLAPNDAALLGAQADALLALGRLEAAEGRFARLLVRRPRDGAALLGLAKAARLSGRTELAAAHLRQAGREARDETARLAVAAEWLALDVPDAARALHAGIGERPEATAALHAELGVQRRRSEGPRAAENALSRALAIDPTNPRALLILADLRREAGRLGEAEELYGRALAARPGFYWALIGQAAVQRERGDGEASRRLLLRAIEADPAEWHAEIELARDLAEGGDVEAARALLARVPPSSPRARNAAMLAARLHREAGDFGAAAEAFEAVARCWPPFVEALVEAAEDRFRSGEDADAERLLAEAAALGREAPARLESEARRALIRDEPEAALALFDRARAADPSRLWPALAAARIEAVLGREDAARARFEVAEAEFGARPDIVIARAEVERLRGRTAEARARIAAALGAYPHHLGLRLAAALADVEAGDFERAAAALDAARPRSEAEHGRILLARSLLHAARWDFSAAACAAAQATRRLPGDGWARQRLVHAAMLDLDLDRAGAELTGLARLEASANRLRGKSANPSQSHYGQILDEFRMDDAAVAALTAARALPVDARLARLAAIVRERPDNTAAAINFFVEHRRAGRLAPVPAAPRPRAIPLAIHQYWDEGSPPADLADYLESWRVHHPGTPYRLWSEAEARAFLDRRCGASVLAAFERAAEPAMKADLFRLALLREEGGLYADADDRCLRNVAPLLAGGHGLLAYQEDLGSLGNNILAAAPGHPVIARALALGVEAVNRGDTDILWLATGPGLLTRAAAQVLAERPEMMMDCRILDRHEILAFAAIHCLAAYKATERHWSRTAFGRSGSARDGKAAQAASV